MPAAINPFSTRDYFVTHLREKGYCILRKHYSPFCVEACRKAFWPYLLAYLQAYKMEPNRGNNRHFLPMPFEPPCFNPEFFFDTDVLYVMQQLMGDKIVADQWGCDVPLRGSDYQKVHADYQRPLFAEMADLRLPPYMLLASFGLVPITTENGAIEIAPGTQHMPREDAIHAIRAGTIEMRAIRLEIGDVLIRHPWTLHRGSPNNTNTPRPLITIRYVRHWYADHSRKVNAIPNSVWASLTPQQQNMMRFPVEPQNQNK